MGLYDSLFKSSNQRYEDYLKKQAAEAAESARDKTFDGLSPLSKNGKMEDICKAKLLAAVSELSNTGAKMEGIVDMVNQDPSCKITVPHVERASGRSK